MLLLNSAVFCLTLITKISTKFYKTVSATKTSNSMMEPPALTPAANVSLLSTKARHEKHLLSCIEIFINQKNKVPNDIISEYSQNMNHGLVTRFSAKHAARLNAHQ